MASYLDHRRRQDPIITGHPGLVLLFAVLLILQFYIQVRAVWRCYFQLRSRQKVCQLAKAMVKLMDSTGQESACIESRQLELMLGSVILVSRLVPMVGPTMNSQATKS